MVKPTPITPPTTPPAMGPAFEASCDPCVMFVFDDSVLELFEEDGDLSQDQQSDLGRVGITNVVGSRKLKAAFRTSKAAMLPAALNVLFEHSVQSVREKIVL